MMVSTVLLKYFEENYALNIYNRLNIDPGTITFEERGILVKESVGVAQVPVLRKNGADGEVSVRWRTIGKTI